MNARRKQIRKKYLQLQNQIKRSRKAMIELAKKDFLLSDDVQQYREENVTRGRGKTKKTQLEGRVYWKEKYYDEDYPKGKPLIIERSYLVRVDGEWVDIGAMIEHPRKRR
jgi:hypothetical protein